MDENKFKKLKKFLDTGKLTDRAGTKINFNKLDKRIKTIDLETAKSPSPSKHSKGGLKGNQKKLAAKAPPPNKIDEKDFKVLREEKARGRGMGLQDESVQPGKVMKAKRGHFSKSNVSGHKRVMGVFPTIDKVPPTAKGKDLLKKNTTPLKALGKVATSRAGALGAILGAGAVGLNIAGKKLKEFADKKKKPEQKPIQQGEKRKKMGGGMMKKYSTGGGADSGRIGEMKSRIGIAMNKAKRLRSMDRLTDRDIEKASSLVKRRSRNEDRLTNKDLEYAKAGLTSAAAPIGTSVIKAAKKFRDNYKADVRDRAKVKKMGGGMIAPSQRPGYSKGTMVKARGCKLGRTRPTKIT